MPYQGPRSRLAGGFGSRFVMVPALDSHVAIGSVVGAARTPAAPHRAAFAFGFQLRLGLRPATPLPHQVDPHGQSQKHSTLNEEGKGRHIAQQVSEEHPSPPKSSSCLGPHVTS